MKNKCTECKNKNIKTLEDKDKTPSNSEWLWVATLFGLFGGNDKVNKDLEKGITKETERQLIMSDKSKIKNCADCESQLMLKYSELSIEYDKLKNYIKLLENCLDIKEELNRVLREDNENLRYKNELYLEKTKKLEGEDD